VFSVVLSVAYALRAGM